MESLTAAMPIGQSVKERKIAAIPEYDETAFRQHAESIRLGEATRMLMLTRDSPSDRPHPALVDTCVATERPLEDLKPEWLR